MLETTIDALRWIHIIAGFTAFSVVNFSFLPPLVRWLWPTAVGVPLLSIWVRSYSRKFTERSRSDRLETAKILAPIEIR
jgi:hypothetical protein